MKRSLLLLLFISVGIISNAQGLKGLIKKAAAKDSTGTVSKLIPNSNKDSLTTNDVIAGLKAALETGTNKSVQKLSATDGFFKDAVTIQDAWGILRGGDSSATKYLREKTTASLITAFRPVIENSLDKVNATKNWEKVFTTYNRFSKDKVNTDLAAYVTEKALYGIFYQVAQEEMSIRKDPVARTSDILKKVFGGK